MTPERWLEVKSIFTETVERTADEWGAYLALRCGGDAELRLAVERLLDAHGTAADFMEASPVAGLVTAAAGHGRFTGSLRGSYRVGRLIGAGGMGEVYEGVDARTGERAAIKVLTDAGADATRRLKREAAHALALDHPNICRILGVVDEDEDAGAYIAMELIEGTALADAVPESGFEPSAAVPIAHQLAEAIAHAHGRGIVHRDLKSENIMVTADGHVKVLDFGLARRLPRAVEYEITAASLTEKGTIAGTLSYLAPEVLRGERADARSDVWAFGIVLHELLAGRQPFNGRTPFELTSAVLREPPAALSSAVPAGLRVIRDNCLAKDPAERYQDGGEVLAAIRALQSGARIAPLTRRRLSIRAALAASVAAIVLTGLTGWMLTVGRNAPPTAGQPAVAILPLRATGDATSDYFADGITEALIGRLGAVDALRVISRGSVMRYRDAASLEAVRRDLGADAVVRGSVERAGDRVQVTVDLIDATTGRSRWRDTFGRRANEVLALQNDIARAIAGQLGVRVSGEEMTRLRLARAVDPEVYENYLKGRFQWNKRTDGSLQEAVRYFQSAVDRDPTYAPAHAALADCYNQLGTVLVGTVSPAEARPRAKAEAIAAIQIDESLAEAHAALGYASHYDWDWPTAERELRRAIELNPNLALAHVWYANYLVSRGRLAEAVAEVQRAELLDPFSLVVVTNVGWTLSYAGRGDEAMAAYRRALALDGTYVQARARLAGQLARAGRFPESIGEYQKLAEMLHHSAPSIAWLAQAYAAAGQRGEAIRLLNEVLRRSREKYVPPIAIANIYLALDDKDHAFTFLEQAYRERSNGLAYLAVDPNYTSIRDDPRYRRLVARVGVSDAR